MRKPYARCANGYGALLLAMLAASPIFAGDILVITNEGTYVIPVNGSPGASLTIEQWWPGDVVDQRGEKPPTDDKIAEQVDAWADAAAQEERVSFRVAWAGHIGDVRAKRFTTTEIATEEMGKSNQAILGLMSDENRGGWVLFAEKVAELLADEFRKTGGYSLQTFVSIQKGLARG